MKTLRELLELGNRGTVKDFIPGTTIKVEDLLFSKHDDPSVVLDTKIQTLMQVLKSHVLHTRLPDGFDGVDPRKDGSHSLEVTWDWLGHVAGLCDDKTDGLDFIGALAALDRDLRNAQTAHGRIGGIEISAFNLVFLLGVLWGVEVSKHG